MKKILLYIGTFIFAIMGMEVVNAETLGLSIIGDNSVEAGKTAQLQALYTYEDEDSNVEINSKEMKSYDVTNEVNWTSSDKSIATVDQNGLVTGVKKGTVTIRINFSESSEEIVEKSYTEATFTMNVTEKEQPNYKYFLSITLQKNSDGEATSFANYYSVGDTENLRADFNQYLASTSKDNSEMIEKAIKANWISSDENIATVDQNGLVTFKKEGKVVISASYTYEGQTYTNKVEFEVKSNAVEKDEAVEKTSIMGKQTKINPPTGFSDIALYIVIGAIIIGSVLHIKRNSFN